MAESLKLLGGRLASLGCEEVGPRSVGICFAQNQTPFLKSTRLVHEQLHGTASTKSSSSSSTVVAVEG